MNSLEYKGWHLIKGVTQYNQGWLGGRIPQITWTAHFRREKLTYLDPFGFSLSIGSADINLIATFGSDEECINVLKKEIDRIGEIERTVIWNPFEEIKNVWKSRSSVRKGN